MRKLFWFVFAAATLSAQNTPSKQDQILNKLDRILQILEEAAAPEPPIKVDISRAPVMGMDQAPITIVEFTDFQCPYCNKFHVDTFPELHDKYIATGKIRFVSRDLPLPMHKNALQAAEAGRCAGEQGHFWEMRDWMQSNPTKLEISDLAGHAQAIDLDLGQYRSCMAEGKYRSAVQADADKAQELGIKGTPAFIVGKSGSVIEGPLMMGAPSIASLEKAILALK